jgi:hypothetical protein
LTLSQEDYCGRVSGPFPVDSFESRSIAGEYTVLKFPVVVIVQGRMEYLIRDIARQF